VARISLKEAPEVRTQSEKKIGHAVPSRTHRERDPEAITDAYGGGLVWFKIPVGLVLSSIW